MGSLRIWKLHVRDNYCGFIPHDLRFFYDRFRCQSLAESWERPPATIDGKSKPLPDFAGWVTSAPLVSERAADLINDLAADDVELLPFHPLKGKPYWVMNVLRCEDFIDGNRSNFEIANERFIFREELPSQLPPIFKCPEWMGDVFVSKQFAEMIVANKLRGAALADPGEPTFPLILSRSEINRYPGVPT